MVCDLGFKKTKCDPAIFERLDSATLELNRLTGQEFSIVRLMFGKALVLAYGDLVAVMVSTRKRPSTITIVAVRDNNRILLPLVREEDFDEMCVVLKIEDNETLNWLRELVKPALRNVR